jgi:RES domain-containing protein
MLVWRLAIGRFRELDGEGARLYGGRWNSPGVSMVYSATQVSLALLEQLVHLNPEELPDTFRAFAINLPDDESVEVLAGTEPPADRDACRHYGDGWATSRRTAALIVPSLIVAPSLQPGDIATEERNVLLNPHHPSASGWQVRETSFRVDGRLRGGR